MIRMVDYSDDSARKRRRISEEADELRKRQKSCEHDSPAVVTRIAVAAPGSRAPAALGRPFGSVAVGAAPLPSSRFGVGPVVSASRIAVAPPRQAPSVPMALGGGFEEVSFASLLLADTLDCSECFFAAGRPASAAVSCGSTLLARGAPARFLPEERAFSGLQVTSPPALLAAVSTVAAAAGIHCPTSAPLLVCPAHISQALSMMARADLDHVPMELVRLSGFVPLPVGASSSSHGALSAAPSAASAPSAVPVLSSPVLTPYRSPRLYASDSVSAGQSDDDDAPASAPPSVDGADDSFALDCLTLDSDPSWLELVSPSVTVLPGNLAAGAVHATALSGDLSDRLGGVRRSGVRSGSGGGGGGGYVNPAHIGQHSPSTSISAADDPNSGTSQSSEPHEGMWWGAEWMAAGDDSPVGESEGEGSGGGGYYGWLPDVRSGGESSGGFGSGSGAGLPVAAPSAGVSAARPSGKKARGRARRPGKHRQPYTEEELHVLEPLFLSGITQPTVEMTALLADKLPDRTFDQIRRWFHNRRRKLGVA